jgi:hypothetical protein
MILHLIRRRRPMYVFVGLVMLLALLAGIQAQRAQSASYSTTLVCSQRSEISEHFSECCELFRPIFGLRSLHI